MEVPTKCSECGAIWTAGETCETCFHQMLFWEAEYPAYGEVHHLMVLCYHLQHPCLYTPDGLKEARRLLVKFVERGASPAQVRQRNRTQVDSSKRKWKIKAIASSHGSYDQPVRWTLTAADVVAGGSENYCDNVRAWAKLINATLKTLP
jgi:hypothetical protein